MSAGDFERHAAKLKPMLMRAEVRLEASVAATGPEARLKAMSEPPSEVAQRFAHVVRLRLEIIFRSGESSGASTSTSRVEGRDRESRNHCPEDFSE